MPAVPVRVDPTVHLDDGFAAIRAQLGVTAEFPPEAQAEAEDAAAHGPSIAAGADRRDTPFFTVDPAGSTDLDQAMFLERGANGRGYVVHYAIADVGAFVRPGGALDAEARRRAVTIYLPDGRVPLHPPVLSEGAASLLPDQERQALVWRIALDDRGEATDVSVERARMRSRRRLTYAEAESLDLLREIGTLRQERETERGGVSLPIPEQVVVEVGGRYDLAYRAPLPAEGWNAQISLLTGIAAAGLMLDAGVGVLRTLPPPSPDTIDQLRRRAKALGIEWPAAGGYQSLVRSLDPTVPRQAALLTAAARLFRGAGYLAFEGTPPEGAARLHAGVAAPYAHVTAPLRRLVDRFANEVVLSRGRPPSWASEALHELPALMAAGTQKENAANGLALDLVETAVLSSRVGEVVEAVVTNLTKEGAQVQVREPAVVTVVHGHHFDLGQELRLRVTGDGLEVVR
jgi:exoribonuclease R